ncbi:MAG: hypothetical protein KBT87_11310 [Gammaproteobacteria bacterium]|jgi:hypothetical protein|nr:hypothetical protein [Gammaproteobacteria bacterium]MBQ0775251.1 hypothetical protein [Gammaproteobacteria bacterium]
MIIFAFSTDDNGLEVFPTKDEAINYCEGIDVEEGLWLFWDESGENMEAKFSVPNKKDGSWVQSGVYDLVPFPIGLELIEFISNVGYVEGRGIFNTVQDIRLHLTRGCI